jgi:hypothetical protein
MVRRFCPFTFAAIAALSALYAQIPAAGSKDAAEKQKLLDAAAGGVSLPANMTVTGNAEVQAVLLPPKICKKLFGKEVSESYAAIELIVSNNSQDATLILHSVFLDYSKWLLSGSPVALNLWFPSKKNTGPAQANPGDTGAATQGKSDDTVAAQGKASDAAQSKPGASETSDRDRDTQAGTLDSQVATAEYRIVRGQALAQQPWTTRNFSMRVLDLLGAVATGSEFAFKEQGIVKGIGVFTGQAVPGIKTLFPDGTIDELNRISDLGFRTDMTIPKASSDILVGFFPIDRFLTPGLKKLFLRSPAIFFVPGEGLADPVTAKELNAIIKRLLAPEATDSKKNNMDPNNLNVSALFGTPMLLGLSLNNIQVKISGAMTVDPDTIPARVDSMTCTPADGANWKSGATITCVIQGTLLSGGQAVIDENVAPSLKSDANSSTSTQLHFTMVLSSDQQPCATLHVHVTKVKNNTTLDSNKYAYTVPASGGGACPAPASK